jgi:YD repeat-containing protein
VQTSYGFDAVDRLERLTHTNSFNQPIEDFQFAYNIDNEIKSITSLASATQLPQAKTVAPADAANKIAQFGEASYSFDELGMTTSKTDGQGVTSYQWDARGRLAQTTLPNGQAVNYSYDANGRLASRAANGSSTSFLYDGLDVVLDRGSDGSQVDYLNGAGLDNKLRQSSNATGALYFLQD